MKQLWDEVTNAVFMLKRAYSPFSEYDGTPIQISHTIIQNCFNGKFFQVSTGHFPQFYTRDFGMCVEALCQLGYKTECKSSIAYALSQFSSQNKITTTIDKRGKCVDFFAPAPDSLAFLLHAIEQTKYKLSPGAIDFLNDQIALYHAIFWDSKRNTVRQNTYFSSAKDHYKRNASCYDFCMVAWVDALARRLKLHTPFTQDFRSLLFTQYWDDTQGYFKDDLDAKYVASDAQIFPFYTGLLDIHTAADANYFTKALAAIRNAKLDEPFPIQYTQFRDTQKEIWQAKLAPNYEGDTIWIHIGLCYLRVIADYDTELLATYMQKYTELIKTHRNFLEVFTKKGKPYRSLLYKSDESMLWVSCFLYLRTLHSKF